MLKVHFSVGHGADVSCGIDGEGVADNSGSIDGEGTSWCCGC